jgi:hypothetical protein
MACYIKATLVSENNSDRPVGNPQYYWSVWNCAQGVRMRAAAVKQ